MPSELRRARPRDDSRRQQDDNESHSSAHPPGAAAVGTSSVASAADDLTRRPTASPEASPNGRGADDDAAINVFPLDVSNSAATTMSQIATVSKDWFLGFNVSRNCSEKLDNTFQWSNR